MSTEDDDDENPSQRFWNKLNYLLTVGYKQDVIDAFKKYCLDEDFDEEAITDDFDDITDSSITEHLQETYDWKDKKRNDFFLKVREALQTSGLSPIEATDQALKRYYKSENVNTYNKNFINYCNGNDIKDLEGEFQLDPWETSIVDFDEKFPYPEELKEAQKTIKQRFIFDTIKLCCKYPNYEFTGGIPNALLSNKTTKYIFHDINDEDIKQTEKIYQDQCKAIWNQGMNSDASFKFMTAIGVKYEFNYLQYLVDAFLSERIKKFQKGKPWSIEQWAKSVPHVNSLLDLPVNTKFSWEKNQPKTNKNIPKSLGDIIKGGMKSFFARTVPKQTLQTGAAYKYINDSIEITVRYIHTMVGFIKSLLTNSNSIRKPICPFQIDFVIVYDKPKGIHLFHFIVFLFCVLSPKTIFSRKFGSNQKRWCLR